MRTHSVFLLVICCLVTSCGGSPSNSSAGQKYLDEGNYQDALLAGDQLIKSSPASIEGYRIRGAARYNLHRDEPVLQRQ